MEMLSKNPKYRVKSDKLLHHVWCKLFAPQLTGTFDKKKKQFCTHLQSFVKVIYQLAVQGIENVIHIDRKSFCCELSDTERDLRVRLSPLINCSQNRMVEQYPNAPMDRSSRRFWCVSVQTNSEFL